MNISQDKVNKILEAVDPKNQDSVNAAAAAILGESESPIKSGSKVAVIDDPTYAHPGVVGTCVGRSSKGEGFTDVRFADGRTMPLQNDLLIPV